MEQKKGIVKFKFGDEDLCVEILDVNRDGLLLVTVLVGRGEDDNDTTFFDSKPTTWRTYESDEEIVEFEVNLFRSQLARQQ